MMQYVFNQYHKNTDTLDGATPEIDGRGFREISRHNWYFTEEQVAGHTLGNDLSIEDKIVAVLLEADGFQIFPRIGTETRVDFR